LEEAGIDPEACIFEMTAIGPIFEEQETMPDHKPLRDKTAALERALADELKRRGYAVLGTHPRATEADPTLLRQVVEKLDAAFPELHQPEAQVPRFHPIQLRGNGPTASEILLRDRGRE
jgi:hypothetical protein